MPVDQGLLTIDVQRRLQVLKRRIFRVWPKLCKGIEFGAAKTFTSHSCSPHRKKFGLIPRVPVFSMFPE